MLMAWCFSTRASVAIVLTTHPCVSRWLGVKPWLLACLVPTHYPNQCWLIVNTLRPRSNRHHIADDIFKCIFYNENVLISIKTSLKFNPKGPINNILALVQIMAWRRPGDKPLSEPMVIILLTHICVTRPQWVNWTFGDKFHWNLKSNSSKFHTIWICECWLQTSSCFA